MVYTKEKYDPKVLKRLQETEQEILDVVDVFCKKHNIKYSLAYGTLLGAIRHKGFIPWDDDIDIMMLREDYEKFRECWLKEQPKGYVLVDDVLYPDFTENFIKIRKEGTTFLQFEIEKEKDMPLGIFLDIFPLDRLAPTTISRKMQKAACLLNMLNTRNHTANFKGIKKFFIKTLISFPLFIKKVIKKATRKYIQRWNKKANTNLFCSVSLDGFGSSFKGDLFNSYTKVEFGGKEYMAVGNYDQHLNEHYGDYMKLPPKEKRYSHYPLILDFENEYKREKSTI